MLLKLPVWCVLLAGAVVCASRLPPLAAFAVWAVVMGGLCLLGVYLISRQPLETATRAGLVGYLVAHWGWRAGGGRLPGAAMISWLVWLVVGGAAMGIYHGRGDIWRCLLVLSWLVLTLALMYLLGQMIIAQCELSFRPNGLFKLAAALVLILIASIGLSLVRQPWAQSMALAIAGGPVVVVGGGYGLFVLLIFTVGRNARWN